MALQAGDLDRRITLLERAPKLDTADTGQDVGDWARLERDATPWAKVEAVSGGEAQVADQPVAVRTLDVTIWWRADVRDRGVEMVVLYEGKAYAVADVAEVGHREALRLRVTGRAEQVRLR